VCGEEHKIQILAFRVDDRRFGLQLLRVRRVVRAVDPTPLPQAPEAVLGVIDLQGTIVPVLNIRGKFGFPLRDIGLADQFIIADTSSRIVALLVDSTIEVLEFPADAIVQTRQFAQESDQVDGVVRLQDGLLLIQDLERFLSSNEQLVLEEAITGQLTHGN
jgi:purine-binding chemotaxis protein CheW